jgi:hypothetical protein
LLSPLHRAVLDNIPSDLFSRLKSRQEQIYSEARAMAFETTLWDKPEAESVFPINRRAIFEGELRRTCRVLDIPFKNSVHHGENYWYVLVKSGNLLLTAHHVDRPKRFVRPASSRKQNAAVNRLLLQPCIEELLLEPLPKLDGLINAHVLHGLIRERVGDRVISQPFMTLAFPHPEIERYVDAWDISEVLQMYATRDSSDVEQTVVVEEAPKVTLKPDADKVDEREKKKKDRSRRKDSASGE